MSIELTLEDIADLRAYERERATYRAEVLELKARRLLPGEHELSATVLMEIEDKAERERFLVEARGLDRSFALYVDGERCPGQHDVTREHPERTTAVHYLKFLLGEASERALRDVVEKKRKPSEVAVEVAAEHPRYTARATLPAEEYPAVRRFYERVLAAEQAPAVLLRR